MRVEAVYGGYLHRQQAEIRGFAREEAVSLDGVAFELVGGLSAEIRDKLASIRPASFGAAARIQGMTPAALAALSTYLRKREAVSDAAA
jgi:tRNA uridine 5-carboxymethylaminomethyl modification enzyme